MSVAPIFHAADGGCRHCDSQAIYTTTLMPYTEDVLRQHTSKHGQTYLALHREHTDIRISVSTCIRCDAPTHPDLVAMGDDMPTFDTPFEDFDDLPF